MMDGRMECDGIGIGRGSEINRDVNKDAYLDMVCLIDLTGWVGMNHRGWILGHYLLHRTSIFLCLYRFGCGLFCSTYLLYKSIRTGPPRRDPLFVIRDVVRALHALTFILPSSDFTAWG